jgi:hypothetical protein
MDWILPENWRSLSLDARVAWHAERVDSEEVAYEYLEKTGLWTLFETHQIEARLSEVRSEIQRVESALAMYQDVKFKVLLESRDRILDQRNTVRVTRAKLLQKKFKRKNFKSTVGEEELLAILRKQEAELHNVVGQHECRIIEVCRIRKIEAAPYLKLER